MSKSLSKASDCQTTMSRPPSLAKLTEPLVDTPQSIDTISQQLIKDRATANLNDAFRHIPGITIGAGEFKSLGTSPTIRGFVARTDMYIDVSATLAIITAIPSIWRRFKCWRDRPPPCSAGAQPAASSTRSARSHSWRGSCRVA